MVQDLQEEGGLKAWATRLPLSEGRRRSLSLGSSSGPILSSPEPGQYTQDLAVIKTDTGKLDAGNYRGNSISIGNKYTRQQFMDKIHLNTTSPFLQIPCWPYRNA